MTLTSNKKFLNFLTNEEMKEIENNAMVISDNCIIITTDKYFFELSVDKSLEIFCMNEIDKSENDITKEQFIKFFKESIITTIPIIEVD
jgi:predicted permease